MIRQCWLKPRSVRLNTGYYSLDVNDFRKQVISQQEARHAFGFPKDRPIIGFVCRLASDKNALAFLRVAELVRQLNPNAYFVVAGSGPNEPVFRSAFENNLKDHGKFLGFCTEIPALLSACDVTVSVSIQEGFGLRVLESFAAGRPCISYAVGGVPEVMSLNLAEPWLIPAGDEVTL